MSTEHITRDEQGRVRERFFQDEQGRLEGVATLYDEEGRVRQESSWHQGELQGPTSLRDATGRVMQRIMYQGGRLEGPTVFYDGQGRATLEVTFHEGQAEGELIAHQDGQLVQKQSLSAGRPHGPLELYEHGALSRREIFSEGTLVHAASAVPSPPPPRPPTPSTGWLQDWMHGGGT